MIHHHKPQCLVQKERITAFRVKVTVKGQNVNVCPGDIFLTTKHFVSKFGIVIHRYGSGGGGFFLMWEDLGRMFNNLFPACACVCESECHGIRLACYFQGQGHCKSSYDQQCDNFYCIVETADPFVTRLGLIVHYDKPECFMEKLDYCVQGQGHSKNLNECWSR